MTLFIILWLLFIHWVGDFILQNMWMSQHKSKNIKALSSHIILYTIFIWLLTINYKPFPNSWALFNGGSHFIIDFITSKQNKKLWEQQKVHNFFVSIGFDQFLHTSILLLTWGVL